MKLAFLATAKIQDELGEFHRGVSEDSRSGRQP